ncbi:MAG: TonB-dependent receptor plug domain-containing protein, partial [Planctomycetales bacterium]
EGAVSRTNLSQDISPESFHCFRLLAKGSYQMKTPLLRGYLPGQLAVIMVVGFSLTVTQRVFAQPPADGESSASDETPGRVVIDRLGDPEETSASEDDDTATLPEVTVTAPFPRRPLGDDTVVSASPTETARRQVGSSVTVITEEDIQRRGSRTLNEILRSIPGFDVRQSGGPGQQSTIFTRGTNGSQTKVLLDGIPLNDPSSPNRAFDPANFLLDNVQRIEVIRGPQSTIYGSDAIGGVVNIVTRRGEGPTQVRTTHEGGSFGTYTQATTISGGTENFWYSLSGAWFTSDGFSAASAGTEDDGYENGTLSGRVGVLLTDDWDVDVSWRYVDSDVDLDGFLADAARNLDNEQFFLRAQTTLTQLDGILEHRAGYSFASYKRDDRGGFQSFFDGESHRFDYQAKLTTIDDGHFSHSVTGGVEHIHEDVLQDTSSMFIFFPAAASQFGTGGFVENQFAVNDRWFTTAGYRHDDYSRAGTADTYRVTSRFLIPESHMDVHGAIGTGFRSPALAEVAAGFGFDPNLRPEESFGWEVGAEKRMFDDKVVVDATYFRNDLDNLIVFRSPTFTAMNVGSALTAGVEVSGQVELDPDTFLTASYTNTKTRDNGTRNELLRRPRHKFDATLSRFLCDHQAQVSMNLRYVGARDDFDATFARTTLSEYFVLNASTWWQVSKNVRLFARVDNITDQQFEDVFGFNTADVSAYGGVTIALGGYDEE